MSCTLFFVQPSYLGGRALPKTKSRLLEKLVWQWLNLQQRLVLLCLMCSKKGALSISVVWLHIEPYHTSYLFHTFYFELIARKCLASIFSMACLFRACIGRDRLCVNYSFLQIFHTHNKILVNWNLKLLDFQANNKALV